MLLVLTRNTLTGIQAKLDALKALGTSTPFSFYNANIATLHFSNSIGGSGFSGICANFYPQLVAWLCANTSHPRASSVQDFLSVAENVVMYKVSGGNCDV